MVCEHFSNKPKQDLALKICITWHDLKLNLRIAQSAGAVEYTDCFSAEE